MCAQKTQKIDSVGSFFLFYALRHTKEIKNASVLPFRCGAVMLLYASAEIYASVKGMFSQANTER